MDDIVQQILTTDDLQQDQKSEQQPTEEFLTEPPKVQSKLMPRKYNTRMTAFKKNLSDFIVQEQEMLDRVRKNQQRPTARNASTPHGQWLHSKDWVNINLLRADIPIIKSPNYSLTKRYKTRNPRFKKAPVTSTTSSNAACSTMSCEKTTSNEK